MKIVIEYIHPPIPNRSCDWRAWIDGNEEDGPVGWGATKEEALRDLEEEMSESYEEPAHQ